MIDMLKRPSTPKAALLGKVPHTPPQCAENGEGESDTDIEDDEDSGCGAESGIANGSGGGRGASTPPAVGEEVRREMESSANRKYHLPVTRRMTHTLMSFFLSRLAIKQGGTHNKCDGSGKMSSKPCHRRTARRLHFPRGREKRYITCPRGCVTFIAWCTIHLLGGVLY